MRVLIFALLGLSAPLYGEDPLTRRVEAFVQPRWQTVAPAEAKPNAVADILARPDPGTQFLYYAFGLKQHAKQLLSDDQAKHLNAVLDQDTPAHSRWHDERNALRCKFNELAWQYAGCPETESAALRRELEEWMRLRMAWTQQEHIAQYRFARDVWSVLTAEQQSKLLAGEWKAFAKQDTGHTRDDATAKMITRALGKSDDQAVFDTAIAQWAKERAPMQASVAETENHERRIVFAMDLNSERLAFDASEAANKAFAKLYLTEADAIRRIVQASYTAPAARCSKAAADAWSEATQRFQAGARELLELLQQH